LAQIYDESGGKSRKEQNVMSAGWKLIGFYLSHLKMIGYEYSFFSGNFFLFFSYLLCMKGLARNNV